MRKYLVIMAALAFLLFALGLMAQSTANSGQSTNAQSGTNSSQNPNSPAGDETSNQTPSSSSGTYSGSQSGSKSSMGTDHQAMGKAKTLEGCVVREETDYFLIPKRGNPVRLEGSGANDVSAHLNHRVKVHGNEEPASATGTSASTTGGTSGTATTGSASNPSSNEPSTSGSMSSNTGSTGSMSGNAGATGSTSGTTSGVSGNGNLHTVARNEIVVDRIDMVSESCPANWNSNWKNGTWTGSNTGNTKGTSSTNPY